MIVLPVLLIGGLLLMAGGSGTKKHRPPTPTPQPSPQEAEAITFCEAQGGTVSVMEDTEGVPFFMCSFPDGRMVEAEAFARGESQPTCPVEMMYDAETERCVPIAQPGPQPGPGPEPVDPNFQICMGAALGAWAPFTEADGNLSPAVADNVYLVMVSAVEESWVGYQHAEALAQLGMAYVAPECDFVALIAYVEEFVEVNGVLPGPAEDLQRLNDVYATVLALATDALENADIPPDIHQGESQSQMDQGIDPDHGGVMPKCPPNYFYDAVHDVCCPDGFYWNNEDQMCRPMGYGGLHNISALRQAVSGGYAGGCGGRRGHCGVRPRA